MITQKVTATSGKLLKKKIEEPSAHGFSNFERQSTIFCLDFLSNKLSDNLTPGPSNRPVTNGRISFHLFSIPKHAHTYIQHGTRPTRTHLTITSEIVPNI